MDDLRPMSDLVTSGMLWYINKNLLHPQGLALTLLVDDDGDSVIGWGISTSDEPWTFPEEVDRMKAEEVDKLFSEARSR